MSAPSAYTAYVEATTDVDPSGPTPPSAWTAWLQVTTDADPGVTPDVPYRFVRRAGGWVAITGRKFRRNGVWV
jgi:hypothetical protein